MTTDEATTGITPTRIEEEGRKPTESALGAEGVTVTDRQTKAEAEARQLMEAVVERTNLLNAYQRVMGNKGAAGVDGLPVEELKPWLQQYWPSVRAALLDGSYMPSPIRKVEIPKPNGGVRTLGIPTVLDRLIQQALLQILQPLFEPGFSASSFGFRPGRNAWQAVAQAKQYLAAGRRWVVDLDLAQFFDRVNHDMLMSRLARQVTDERVLKLIRRYLEGKLRLKVNRDKSAVARPWQRKFLGYSFTWHKQPRVKIAPSSLERLKARVRELMRIGRGRNIVTTIDALAPVLRGWMSYYRLTEVRGVLQELDGWIRRELRCILWRQWKRPLTRTRMLQKQGLSENRARGSAQNQLGPWWNAGASHMNEAYPKRWFSLLGLVSLLDTLRRFQCV